MSQTSLAAWAHHRSHSKLWYRDIRWRWGKRNSAICAICSRQKRRVVSSEDELESDNEAREIRAVVEKSKKNRGVRAKNNIGLCTNNTIASNYGLCVYCRPLRNGKVDFRKSSQRKKTTTRGGGPLTNALNTSRMWSNFHSNAQTNEKRIEIEQHHWIHLVTSPCAYCTLGRRLRKHCKKVVVCNHCISVGFHCNSSLY